MITKQCTTITPLEDLDAPGWGDFEAGVGVGVGLIAVGVGAAALT
ncbi:daptide-type RiPP [Actinomyces sp. oral taxon 175]|nr:daptide-type RiPP [Actinomyces sp. oral taxon 175]